LYGRKRLRSTRRSGLQDRRTEKAAKPAQLREPALRAGGRTRALRARPRRARGSRRRS
jgi:hypothetical protein